MCLVKKRKYEIRDSCNTAIGQKYRRSAKEYIVMALLQMIFMGKFAKRTKPENGKNVVKITSWDKLLWSVAKHGHQTNTSNFQKY